MKALIVSMILLGGLAAQAQQNHREAILGFLPRTEALYLQVASGGCTFKEDFHVSKEKTGEKTLLTFFRERPDECLALLPAGVTLTFSYDELGLKPGEHFSVTNPVRESVVW